MQTGVPAWPLPVPVPRELPDARAGAVPDCPAQSWGHGTGPSCKILPCCPRDLRQIPPSQPSGSCPHSRHRESCAHNKAVNSQRRVCTPGCCCGRDDRQPADRQHPGPRAAAHEQL